MALRGANGHEELDKSDRAVRKMGFEVKEIKDEELSDGSKRVIGYLEKMTKTPKTFPRKYSIIKQKPL